MANFTNLQHSTALINSRQGKDMILMGATLPLDITKDTLKLPSGRESLRYTQAPYAFSEASPNPWSSALVIAFQEITTVYTPELESSNAFEPFLKSKQQFIRKHFIPTSTKPPYILKQNFDKHSKGTYETKRVKN